MSVELTADSDHRYHNALPLPRETIAGTVPVSSNGLNWVAVRKLIIS